MKSIGIICEFNPIHNGHIYFIKEIKKKYPDYVLIAIINGYFLQRGEISLLSKEDKTKLALDNNIDLVLSLPFIYGTQSADNFAFGAVSILNMFNVEKIIFGSESNDLELLIKELNKQDKKVIETRLKTGISYASAIGFNSIDKSNDILGLTYLKAINKINKKITPETIKRTNNYYNNEGSIKSASDIRLLLKDNKSIKEFIPNNVINNINIINENLYYNLLKYQIITNHNLKDILLVDEGIENKLLVDIIKSKDINEFIELIKSKRITYNKINRMIVHIIINTLKKDIDNIKNIDYIKILGFNDLGSKYLNKLDNKNTIKELSKNYSSKIYQYERKCSIIYQLLINKDVLTFENNNKPIIKHSND